MTGQEVTVISAWTGWLKSFKPRDCAALYVAILLGLDLEIAFRTGAVYGTFLTNMFPRFSFSFCSTYS